MKEFKRVIRPGVYQLPDERSIKLDLSKLNLPATVPVTDEDGKTIGKAEIDKDGNAKITLDGPKP